MFRGSWSQNQDGAMPINGNKPFEKLFLQNLKPSDLDSLHSGPTKIGQVMILY